MAIYSKVDLSNKSQADKWTELVADYLTTPNLHYVGKENEPAFEGTWVNFGSTHLSAAFYKDSFERVWVQGSVKSGSTGTTIFTLPEGYRPSKIVVLPTVQASAAAGAWIEVLSTGAVVGYGTALSHLSINLNFRV